MLTFAGLSLTRSTFSKMVADFPQVFLSVSRHAEPGHWRRGHQLKLRTVFWSKPHLQFTVFSRELLVLQALKDLKALSSLFPRLCLQQRRLFADGSSWTRGFKKLHGCCLGGFMFDCVADVSVCTPVTRGPPRDELQRRGGGGQVSAIKTQLPLTSLLLACISISPSADPPQALTLLPSVLGMCVVFWPTLTENQKLLLCQHHRQQEYHCSAGLRWKEWAETDKSRDPVSEPLGLFWLKSESWFTELLALNKRYEAICRLIPSLASGLVSLYW